MNNENNSSELIEKFEGFAKYYDQFMLKLVNYPLWVDYIIKIFKEQHLIPKAILDIACGTGIPSLLLAKKGYRIIGIDNSLPMLEVFKEKIAKTNYDIQIVQSDIRNFSIPEKADAAISLYDSINYLLTEDDLKSCLKCVFDSLNPNGIFTFDMNTVYCLESFWGNRETPRTVGDVYSIWQNSYNPEQKISTLTLTVFTDDGRYFKELHKERGYSLRELENILYSVGFTDIKVFSHLTFLPPADTTFRIMVVAQKPA
jgi:ubiquinone/menaquinone biosynthesis C-methylase UbiE